MSDFTTTSERALGFGSVEAKAKVGEMLLKDKREGVLEVARGAGYGDAIDHITGLYGGLNNTLLENQLADAMINVRTGVLQEAVGRKVSVVEEQLAWDSRVNMMLSDTIATLNEKKQKGETLPNLGATLAEAAKREEEGRAEQLKAPTRMDQYYAEKAATKERLKQALDKATTLTEIQDARSVAKKENRERYKQLLNEQFDTVNKKVDYAIRWVAALGNVGGTVGMAMAPGFGGGETGAGSMESHDTARDAEISNTQDVVDLQNPATRPGEINVSGEGPMTAAEVAAGQITSDFQKNDVMVKDSDGNLHADISRIRQMQTEAFKANDTTDETTVNAFTDTLKNEFDENWGKTVNAHKLRKGPGFIEANANNVITQTGLADLEAGNDPFQESSGGRDAVQVVGKFEDMPKIIADLLKHVKGYENSSEADRLVDANKMLIAHGVQESGDKTDAKLTGDVNVGLGHLNENGNEDVDRAVFSNKVKQGEETFHRQRLDTQVEITAVRYGEGGKLALGINTAGSTGDVENANVDMTLHQAGMDQADFAPIRPIGPGVPELKIDKGSPDEVFNVAGAVGQVNAEAPAQAPGGNDVGDGGNNDTDDVLSLRNNPGNLFHVGRKDNGEAPPSGSLARNLKFNSPDVGGTGTRGASDSVVSNSSVSSVGNENSGGEDNNNNGSGNESNGNTNSSSGNENNGGNGGGNNGGGGGKSPEAPGHN